MIGQDRKATPDQHHQEGKVEEVAVTQPQRKSVGTREVGGPTVGSAFWISACWRMSTLFVSTTSGRSRARSAIGTRQG